MKHFSLYKFKLDSTVVTFMLLLVVCFFSATTTNGQTAIAVTDNGVSMNSYKEKVSLHVVHDFFITGETLWFKLYSTQGNNTPPSHLSKVAYAELLDNHWKPVLQAKIHLTDGMGNGSWVLPASLPSGSYLITAYTKNGTGSASIAKKWIQIVNPQKPPTTNSSTTDQKSIAFFPEGKGLVNGLTSIVAFRISQPNGSFANGSGCIIDQKNDTVVRFKSIAEGMGHFEFTPLSGSQYKAVLFDTRASTHPFPVAKEAGVILHLLGFTENSLQITLQQKNGTASNYTIIITNETGNAVSFSANVLNNETGSIKIPANSLSAGLNALEIYDEKGNRLAQRLFFKPDYSTATVTLQPSSTLFTTREKEKVSIITSNPQGKTVPGSFSFAIYKTDSLDKIPNLSNNSSLLRNSLGAFMSDPSLYGPSKNASQEMLDNLLLVLGPEILTRQLFNHEGAVEYSGHIITGKITVKATGAPATGIPVYLTVPGERFHFSNCTSDSTGKVQFDVRKIQGTENIIVQTNPLTDSIYRISIDNPFLLIKDTGFVPPYSLSAANKEDLEKRILHSQLMNAFHSKEEDDFLIPDYIDTTTFYGKPDNAYLLDDYTRFKTMEEVMREYVPEVQVRRSGGMFRYKVNDLSHHSFFTDNPLVLLDGVPIFDINKIMATDPLRIRKMDILSRRYYQGLQTFDGIVSYTTYTGDLGGYPLDATALYLDYPGLQLQRKFHAPVYQSKQEKESSIPDERQLLFWSADVKTDKTGKTDLNFYTSDIPGEYIMVLQGLDAEGNWYYQQYPFKVVK